MEFLSPYLLQPYPVYVPKGTSALAIALDVICYRDPELTEDTDLAILAYRNYVGCEVFRKLVDSKFPDWKLRHKEVKGKKELIQAEACLWKTIWEMLEVIDTRFNLLWRPIHEVFATIVHESLLVTPILVVEKENTPDSTVTNWVRTIQPGINMKLQQAAKEGDRSLNPWGMFPNSYTFRFIDASIFLAGKSDVFRDELFTKMVRERKTLVRIHREQNPKHQGRKANQQGRRTDLERKEPKKMSG